LQNANAKFHKVE